MALRIHQLPWWSSAHRGQFLCSRNNTQSNLDSAVRHRCTKISTVQRTVRLNMLFIVFYHQSPPHPAPAQTQECTCTTQVQMHRTYRMALVAMCISQKENVCLIQMLRPQSRFRLGERARAGMGLSPEGSIKKRNRCNQRISQYGRRSQTWQTRWIRRPVHNLLLRIVFLIYSYAETILLFIGILWAQSHLHQAGWVGGLGVGDAHGTGPQAVHGAKGITAHIFVYRTCFQKRTSAGA